jgi:hypothetical protein
MPPAPEELPAGQQPRWRQSRRVRKIDVDQQDGLSTSADQELRETEDALVAFMEQQAQRDAIYMESREELKRNYDSPRSLREPRLPQMIQTHAQLRRPNLPDCRASTRSSSHSVVRKVASVLFGPAQSASIFSSASPFLRLVKKSSLSRDHRKGPQLYRAVTFGAGLLAGTQDDSDINNGVNAATPAVTSSQTSSRLCAQSAADWL